MRRYGVPFEVLTDNCKQFIERFTRPIPAEVLFERTCREYGITQRLTKRRSPTTTGKIERWHQALRLELLDEAGAFANIEAAQTVIDSWTRTYNHDRPHQSLDMATPSSLFRPTSTTAVPAPPAQPAGTVAAPLAEPHSQPGQPAATANTAEPDAVEIDLLIPPSGTVSLAGHRQIWLGTPFSGRIVTIWACRRGLHVLLEDQHVKTLTSRFSALHLQQLMMPGARPASAAPAALALPRSGPLPSATVIEADRTVDRYGSVQIGAHQLLLDTRLAGSRVTLRLDGDLIVTPADVVMDRSFTVDAPAEAAWPWLVQLHGYP